MKLITSSMLLVVILGNWFILLAQTNKPITRPVEKVIPVKIIDEANDFADNGLPEPYILGEGLQKGNDDLAAKVAKQLSKYETNSLAYLIAVLQKAGFYIIDENQKILYQPTNSQKGMGLAFYDYEVVGMLELSRSGFGTSVEKLAGVMAKDLPSPKKEQFGEMMLQSLREAANIDTNTTPNKANLTKRFWARLIIEIGKNFVQPVDLMKATPSQAKLDIIQASLIERRMLGDLIATAKAQGILNPKDKGTYAKFFKTPHNQFGLFNVNYKLPSVPFEPCSERDLQWFETVEIDATASGITTVTGKLMEAGLEEIGEKLGGHFSKLGTGYAAASLVLSWAKLVAAASQMQGKIKVAEPLPMLRTKSNIAAGERKELTAEFSIKVNNLRQLNCFRTTLNITTGLDFNMPPSGPLGNKPVSWELEGEVSFAGQNSSKTGEFEKIVYLVAPDGAPRDFHNQETDANGISKIYLEGAKQRKNLENQKVVPNPKIAVVRAEIALKNMKDTTQDGVDLGSFGLGVVAGGGLLGIIGSLPEIGFRMKLFGVAVSVPVRDWTPCSEDWAGIINVTRESQQSTVIKTVRLSNGNGTGDGIRQIRQFDEANVVLEPRVGEQVKTQFPNGVVRFRGVHSDISDLIRENDPCCGPVAGRFTSKFRTGKEMKYNRTTKKFVYVHYLPKGPDYELTFTIATENFPVVWREFREMLDSTCSLDDDDSYSIDKENNYQITFNLEPGRYGQRFVNSEGELLQGEKEIVGYGGVIYRWNWALARCKSN